MREQYRIAGLVCFIVLIIGVGISLKKHHKTGIFNYRAELWSDRAGYNLYLPALFVYKWNTQNAPEKLHEKTGRGFFVNYEKNRFVNKYPYGVALFQSPFWLVAQYGLAKDKTSGYDKVNHYAVSIAAVFYACIGIYFLILFGLQHFNWKIVIFGFGAILWGTPMAYYLTIEGGMSHAYCFFIFACFQYFWHKKTQHPVWQLRDKLIFAFLLSAMVIIRPINLVFMGMYMLFAHQKTLTGSWLHLRKSLTWKIGASVILCMVIFYIPHLWFQWQGKEGIVKAREVIGKYEVSYAYGAEGFSNLFSPRFARVWFAPNNGLFTITPLILLVTWAAIRGYWKEKTLHHFLPVSLLLLYSILYATWWDTQLGCGFGHRAIVDILPLLLFPLWQSISQLKNYWRWVWIGLICICMAYTFKLYWHYDHCFYGQHSWDWKEIGNLLKK